MDTNAAVISKPGLISACVLLFNLGTISHAAIITIDSGPVQGIEDSGQSKFLGLPYAQAPTGDRRWRPPSPPKPWSNPFLATTPGHACPQPEAVRDDISFQEIPAAKSEDCLNLNVWTPNIGIAHPVLFWIHGGDFRRGANSSPLYDGTKMSRQGKVVVVSANYRLGPLGFLAHPLLTQESTDHASGNYGLMDLIEALRWVRRNIRKFGGDPNQVTIFGESAGAYAVCDLLVSPQAKGLFSRAIMQSGGCVDKAKSLRESSLLGLKIAHKLGCDGKGALTCLRAKSPASLLKVKTDQEMAYYPNIDQSVLPGVPFARMKDGLATPVPVLLGTNADDANHLFSGTRMETVQDFSKYVHDRWPTTGQKILEALGPKSDREVKDVFFHLMTDAIYTCPARAVARLLSQRGLEVHQYLFSHIPLSHQNDKRRAFRGAYHSAEVPFVFGTVGDARERRLSDRMIEFWAHFASALPLNGWATFEPASEAYLIFDKNVRQATHLESRLCDLLTPGS